MKTYSGTIFYQLKIFSNLKGSQDEIFMNLNGLSATGSAIAPQLIRSLVVSNLDGQVNFKRNQITSEIRIDQSQGAVELLMLLDCVQQRTWL